MRAKRRVGRPNSPNLRSDWKLSIDATVAAEVAILLTDPVTKKEKYGARSRLIQELLKGYLTSLSLGQTLIKAPVLREVLQLEGEV